jgi:hypothetical protein
LLAGQKPAVTTAGFFCLHALHDDRPLTILSHLVSNATSALRACFIAAIAGYKKLSEKLLNQAQPRLTQGFRPILMRRLGVTASRVMIQVQSHRHDCHKHSRG